MRIEFPTTYSRNKIALELDHDQHTKQNTLRLSIVGIAGVYLTKETALELANKLQQLTAEM